MNSTNGYQSEIWVMRRSYDSDTRHERKDHAGQNNGNILAIKAARTKGKDTHTHTHTHTHRHTDRTPTDKHNL